MRTPKIKEAEESEMKISLLNEKKREKSVFLQKSDRNERAILSELRDVI
jgi:hypothetical protein